MSSPFTVNPFSQSIIQVRRGYDSELDAYGNPVQTEAYLQLSGAFAPGPTSRTSGGTTETAGDRDQSVDQPNVYLPSGTDVSPIDAFIINGTFIDSATKPTDGQWYEVDGQSADWPSAFTPAAYGVQVPLKRVLG